MKNRDWMYLIYWILFSISVSSQELKIAFKDRVQTTTLKEMKSKFKVQSLKVFDPFEQKELTYKGFHFQEILDYYYGAWRANENYTLQCDDGYKPILSTEDLKKHKVLLAFAREDGKSFGSNRPGKGFVKYDPFLLVWDNINSPYLKNKKEKGWAWSVTKLLQPLEKDLYVSLEPKNVNLNLGFKHYKNYCIKCHSIQGLGGQVGPSLVDPVSVTKYWQKEALIRWMLNPLEIRLSSKMQKVDYDNKDGSPEEIVEHIYKYLDSFK